MSDTTDLLTSRDTQQAPGDDASSLPPPYQGEQPPPYSADPKMHPVAKADTTCTKQSSTGYKSFRDIIPEGLSDTTLLIASSSFDDKIVRRAFVRKVFSILTVQALFTFSVVCLFITRGGDVEQNDLFAFFISLIIFIAATSALSFSRDIRQRHPWNMLGLVFVTFSLGYVLGTIACFHSTYDVIVTIGAMLTITAAIIAFSAQTYDFTIWYGVRLILTVDAIMFGFLHVLLLPHQ
ncbi:Protein lifeguard 1 [Dissostichus eleginoides]|uniref:Protein lifeguard 1 n=1 Tax=Dissostichus eleginoides TaxID=100907 RepID=A0AAD9B752_DISEL|nr:Protein lifeguard 1 [Dissostichus eleginoides]